MNDHTESELFVDSYYFGWRLTLKPNDPDRNAKIANYNTERQHAADSFESKWPDTLSFSVDLN